MFVRSAGRYVDLGMKSSRVLCVLVFWVGLFPSLQTRIYYLGGYHI